MKVSYLLYQDIEPVDLAAIGVISMARRVIPELSYETLSFDLNPVRLANGLQVLPSQRFDEVSSVDVLMVPGGPGWRAASNDARIVHFIQRVAPQALLCSVCTGAMILAKAGVLDGLRATTKFEVVPPEMSPLKELQTDYPGIQAEAALLVDNDRVVTGGGVTLCIDTTLYLLEKRFGKQAVAEVARIMEYSAAREANQHRFSSLSTHPSGA